MRTKESPEYCLAVAYTRLLPHIIGYGKESLWLLLLSGLEEKWKNTILII